MSESTKERIARLLSEGLEHYGLYETSKAIMTWEQVLELDPSNVDAHDYIKAADRRKRPRLGGAPGSLADQRHASVESIKRQAQDLIREGGYDEALRLLRSPVVREHFDFEAEATVELARSRLVRQYRDAVGDPGSVPDLTKDREVIEGLELSPDAALILSLVDGVVCFADLVTLSGMGDFDAMRILKELLEAGILTVRR